MADLNWIFATGSKDALPMDKNDRRYFQVIDGVIFGDKWIPIKELKNLISDKRVKIKAR